MSLFVALGTCKYLRYIEPSVQDIRDIKNEKVIFSYLIYCSAAAQDIKMD